MDQHHLGLVLTANFKMSPTYHLNLSCCKPATHIDGPFLNERSSTMAVAAIMHQNWYGLLPMAVAAIMMSFHVHIRTNRKEI